MSKLGRVAIGALAVVLTMSACSKGAGVSKAGGAAPPLVLRMGTDDGQGRPASDQVEEFARRVAQLSEGTITVKPVWHAAGTGLSDWDQKVAHMVVDGDLEMGNIPARAWDTEGVTSLRALNAPFLVTTDARRRGHRQRPGRRLAVRARPDRDRGPRPPTRGTASPVRILEAVSRPSRLLREDDTNPNLGYH